MVLGAAAAAAAATGATAVTGGTLFEYNRRNFLYDRKMRQETEYQIMDFRIAQAELWREDVRDIVGLTSVKMETYLVVNAVQLGFCVLAFCEGRLAPGTPDWLTGCYSLALASAFMYLLISVWFSMHASVCAKSCEVRLLTQMVRLPVPSWSELEAARTYASGFEKVDPRQILRVPFVMGTQEQFTQVASGISMGSATAGQRAASVSRPAAAALTTAAAATRAAAGTARLEPSQHLASDPWGLERRGDHIYELDGSLRAQPELLRHFCLVREALQHWQSYDGFARVTMSIGTNQLVTALSYYVIGYVLMSCNAVMAAWLAVMLFMVIAASLIRLDMSLTGVEYFAAVCTVFAGPFLTLIAAMEWKHGSSVISQMPPLIVAAAYAANALWLMFVLHICKVTEQEGGALLPTGFRSVMYIDVFGWIRRTAEQRRLLAAQEDRATAMSSRATPAPSAAPEAGRGPAVEALRYDQQGRPVPLRPEELDGAASNSAWANITDEDRRRFRPSTFVPAEREEEASSQPSAFDDEASKPGTTPWRIFFWATVLLIIVWWVSGALIFAENTGWNALRVYGLLGAGGSRVEAGPEPLQELESELESVRSASIMLSQLRVEHEKRPEENDDKQFEEKLSSPFHAGSSDRFKATWPHQLVKPASLACADTGSGHVAFVASSRFGLFTAKMLIGASATTQKLEFSPSEPCELVDGELLQDVALRCRPSSQLHNLTDADALSGCEALVLHQQGQRLSTCSLANGGHATGATGSLSNGWLGEGDAVHHHQEEITHIALAGSCSSPSGGVCAYVETSHQRLVEVQTAAASFPVPPLSSGDWFPTRVIHGYSPSGSMDLLNGSFLGVLDPSKQEVRVIDSQNSDLPGQRWKLPTERSWTAMCSTKDSLFLLSASRSEVWRFPFQAIAQENSDDVTQQEVMPSEEKPAEQLSQTTALRGRGQHRSPNHHKLQGGDSS